MTKPIFGQNLNCSNVQSCSKNDAVADQSTNKNAAATKESTASNQQGDNPEADGPNKENENEAKTPPLLPKITCPAQIAISMSGCGFLSSYHIGAMLCLQRHATTLLSNVHVYCGASAGALIASLMVLAPDKLEDALKRVYELADKVPNILMYTFDKTFNIDQHLAELVDQHLPQDISVANGKLSISLTKQKDFSNNLINRFPDRDHLMKCLFASCYIPYYTRGQPPIIDGEAYIDGGLSNNLPMISGMHTITISPFSGSAKIAPARSTALLSLDFGRQLTFGQQQFNISWANIVNIYRALYPRPIFTSADQRNTALISRYYEQGYRDTMNYLLKRGYYERGTGTEV